MTHSITAFQDRVCVGVDLHKDTLTAAVLDPRSGETRFRKIACKCRNAIRAFFGELPRPHAVAIESVGFYRWLFDELEPIVDALYLADATQCRALAGRRVKTDREDALNVAELLAAGRLPVAYAAPAPVQELRHWTRHRHHLMRQHAAVLIRTKSILALVNRPGPNPASRTKAPALLRYIKAQRANMPATLVTQLELAADQMVLLERQIDGIDDRLKRTLDAAPFRDAALRVRSFPGVGVVIAATILAEVGDFGRFTHRDAVARYAGLDPAVYNSADSVRTGRIAKRGSRDLRWALVQAAWVARRCDDNVKRLHQRLTKRCGSKRAIVAVARRMLRWMWHAERRGEHYRFAGVREG